MQSLYPVGLYGSGFAAPTTLGTFRVPDDYRHETFLADSRRPWPNGFHEFDPSLTDETYGHLIPELTPGEVYKVRSFKVEGTLVSRECREFLKERRALCLGVHGALLANRFCVLAKKSTHYLSFLSGISDVVPTLVIRVDGVRLLRFAHVSGLWGDKVEVLAFFPRM